MVDVVLKGDRYYLHNDQHAKINIEGNEFDNATAAYLSFKDKSRADEFIGLLPSEAREKAKDIDGTVEWYDKRDHYLYVAVSSKFLQNRHLGDKILKEHDIGSLGQNVMFDVLRLTQNAVESQRKQWEMEKLLKEEQTFKKL